MIFARKRNKILRITVMILIPYAKSRKLLPLTRLVRSMVLSRSKAKKSILFDIKKTDIATKVCDLDELLSAGSLILSTSHANLIQC